MSCRFNESSTTSAQLCTILDTQCRELRPLCGGEAYPRWRHTTGDSRQQKVSFSPKRRKGKKFPPPTRNYSNMISCHHSRHIVQISKPLRALRPPLRPTQRCKRRGGRSDNHGDAVALQGGGGGDGSSCVMSPMDSHDYHYGQFPFFLAYSLFFCPSTHFVSSLRPLGLFSSVILHRCTASGCGPSLADIHRA